MMSSRSVVLLSFVLAAVAGTALFYTSQNVRRAEFDLVQVQKDILREQETMRVLRAEWDYLTRPRRLESLAKQYLPQERYAPDMVSSIRSLSGMFVPVIVPVQKPVRKDRDPGNGFDGLLERSAQGGEP